MNARIKAYRVEINPTPEQKALLVKNFGIGRFVYNLFIDVAKERYANGLPYMSGYSFSKWLNNEYLPANPDKMWIKEVSTKNIKQVIMNADSAFKRFFKKQAKYPRYRKKDKRDTSFYFMNDCVGKKSQFIIIERHRIKVPTLGWIRLKEYGYLPVNAIAKSGNIICKAGRFYLSVRIETYRDIQYSPETDGIGVDMGIKELAVCSNSTVYPNINKTMRVKRLEKRLRRVNRGLSRKYRANKAGNGEWKNYGKQRLKKQMLEQELTSIRTDYINKCIAELVRAKPVFIALEDLNISGMMKNRHLSKSFAGQKLSYFRERLISKCREIGIPVHLVSRWFPSSKTCSHCGYVKQDLKLSDREFVCPNCGCVEDRDYNASLNIKNTLDFALI